MGKIKKNILVVLLISNVIVLISELYKIINALKSSEIIDRFVTFKRLFLYITPENIILKIAVILLTIIALIFMKRDFFRATTLFIQNIIFLLVYMTIMAVVVIISKNSFMEYLNIIISELIILCIFVGLILVKDDELSLSEYAMVKIKVVLFIILVAMPIIRVFTFGKQMFLYLLQTNFFWGISSGFVLMITALFLINHQEVDEDNDYLWRNIIAKDTLIDFFLLASIGLAAFYDHIIKYNFLFTLMIITMMIKSIFKAQSKNKAYHYINVIMTSSTFFFLTGALFYSFFTNYYRFFILLIVSLVIACTSLILVIFDKKFITTKN